MKITLSIGLHADIYTSKLWKVNGRVHRNKGPAHIVYKESSVKKSYYLNDFIVSPEKYHTYHDPYGTEIPIGFRKA